MVLLIVQCVKCITNLYDCQGYQYINFIPHISQLHTKMYQVIPNISRLHEIYKGYTKYQGYTKYIKAAPNISRQHQHYHVYTNRSKLRKTTQGYIKITQYYQIKINITRISIIYCNQNVGNYRKHAYYSHSWIVCSATCSHLYNLYIKRNM